MKKSATFCPPRPHYMQAQVSCTIHIFIQHKKWFRLTSIGSVQQSSNSRQKFHTEPIFCFAWMPIVVFDHSEGDGVSTQKTSYTPPKSLDHTK